MRDDLRHLIPNEDLKKMSAAELLAHIIVALIEGQHPVFRGVRYEDKEIAVGFYLKAPNDSQVN
jgi:hypothetical protein